MPAFFNFLSTDGSPLQMHTVKLIAFVYVEENDLINSEFRDF